MIMIITIQIHQNMGRGNMEYLNYSDELTQKSATAARERFKTSKKPRIGETVTTHNVLGYKRHDGQLRSCYSPYTPQYPADAIAGYVTQHAKRCFYANATEGDECTYSNFVEIKACN